MFILTASLLVTAADSLLVIQMVASPAGTSLFTTNKFRLKITLKLLTESLKVTRLTR